MIYTAVVDINKLDADVSALPLSDEVKAHILSAKNCELRRERCGAYLVLAKFTEKLFGKNPRMLWAENGKPKYENEGIYFNLSHCGDMVAVALSDEGQVGVDIEGEISPERSARLEARFFSELTFSESPLDVKYIYAALTPCGEILPLCEDELVPESHSGSFSARWTLYEAAMKSGGGGFTSLPCLDMMLLETRADIRKLKTKGGTYFITTAAAK